jgi:hypothetical protein
MYANTVNTEITKTERNKVPRAENIYQSMDSMKERTPEEAERGSALRMSSPLKKVARSPGVERMWPSEDMGSLSVRT